MSSAMHLHDDAIRRLAPPLYLDAVSLLYANLLRRTRGKVYFVLVGVVAFHVTSKVRTLFASGGDLVWGSGVPEVFLGVKVDVHQGVCNSGQ